MKVSTPDCINQLIYCIIKDKKQLRASVCYECFFITQVDIKNLSYIWCPETKNILPEGQILNIVLMTDRLLRIWVCSNKAVKNINATMTIV